MESGTRSLLSDRIEGPKPHFPLRLDDGTSTSSSSMLPDRGKSPLTMALDVTNTQLNSVTESFKTHFPHGSEGTKSLLLQGLEGTMALLAARGVEGSKGLYPLNLESLRHYLPYGGAENVKSYLQERLDKPHKSARDRKDSKCNMGERTATTISGDIKRIHHHHHHHQHERSREHKSHSVNKLSAPKSQLTNPRHDAHLTLAIRELHDEEFGLDAVLLAEGGHVGAHCAVLASASPFLKTILLHANDHPAIISVTGTSLTTLQSLVTCLYTGNIPTGANLLYLIEAAKLLRMDELAAVLQKTFFAQGSLSDLPSRLQHLQSSTQRSAVTTTTSTLHGLIPSQEHQPEKFGKKVRSNRLDQILYQKLNVNHLAPSDIPEPSLVPTSQEPSRVPPLLDSSRVPLLDSPRVPPPDLHGGILGELLTKADPLRSIFVNPSIYSLPELAFDTRTSSLKPLNLSKSSKCEASSSASSLSSSLTSTTTSNLTSTATSCSISSSLTSSLASQTDPSLVGLTSLAPTLPGSIPGLLAPLTPANISSMLSPSALASLTSSTALASLGAQHSAITSSKNKCSSSSGSGSSRSRSSSKNGGSGRSSSNSRPCDNLVNSSHNLPLLYTLKGGMATPEMAKEFYEQLKINPQLSSLAGFTSVPNLSSLSSSASLQSLANLHNLSSLQSFPSLFPFLTSTIDHSHIGSMDGNAGMMSDKVIQLSPAEPPSADYNLTMSAASVMASNISSSVVAADDGVLNLSSSAQTIRTESPTVTTSASVTAVATGTSEETTIPSNSGDAIDQSLVNNTPCISVDEDTSSLAPVSVGNNVSTGCQTVAAAMDSCDNPSTVVVSSNEVNCTASTGCSTSEDASPSLLSAQLDASSLPLLLMTSGGNLGNLSQSQPNVTGCLESATDLQGVLPKDSSEGVDTGDDTSSIEVVDEIPGISQAQLQNRNKAMFHAGHMGRKRKGCGDCEGCQVLEDCGQCRFCRDKAKFGGPNRLKQVCVYKRCVHAEVEPEESKKKRKSSGKKGRGKCGGCDGCQRTTDCNECYACLHNAAAQPPARRKVCEMRVCEQQQMEEVRATLSVAGEPSPYSTDSLMAEGIHINSGASSPSPDGNPSTHNDKMKLMRKMLKKKFAQPYSRVSPSKVRTKYYCGECPGCQTTTPCGNCLYCEDMPKFGGPGRYRQKCVKQLCVYHPRLQALKLSNRSKITYDEQHIAPETLNHLGNLIPSGSEEPVVLGCEINPERKEELEHLRAAEIVETDVTEGEDSNTAIQVDTVVEHPSLDKQEFGSGAEMPVVCNISSSDSSKLSTPTTSVGLHLTSVVLSPHENSGLPLVSDSLDSVSRASSPTTECAPTPEPIYESCTTSIDSTTVSSASTIPALASSSVVDLASTTLMPIANVPTPPPTTIETSTPVETKEENSSSLAPAVEEEEEEDEVDEDEEVVSENSDVPSTPSPPPRVRGRGRSRGRGRPHIQTTRQAATLEKKREVQVMRRGRRRRTTRFNLDLDDNSDFEDQLVMSELHDENSTQDLLSEDKPVEKGQNDNGLSEMTHDETSSGPTSLDASDQLQNYSSTSLIARSTKPIEPDVFEFHDSQENVLTNSHETTYSLKHNSPFVFRDEESNQGGRDVNENLGSVGETASA